MSWSYSGDPSSSPLDEARFIMGDTDINDPVLSDEEINYMISQYHSKAALYYNLFLRAAVTYAKAIKRTLGPQSEDPTSRTNFFNSMAAQYKKEMMASTTAGLSLPRYQYPKIFYKGMQSNPPHSSCRRYP